jgi:hypothetical protein
MDGEPRIAPKTIALSATPVAMPASPPTNATKPHAARGTTHARFPPVDPTSTADPRPDEPCQLFSHDALFLP